jgi:hypothetical protein
VTVRTSLDDGIIEHPTREGKVYCCVALDAFSRFVVGWSIDGTPDDAARSQRAPYGDAASPDHDGLVIHRRRVLLGSCGLRAAGGPDASPEAGAAGEGPRSSCPAALS